jgi:hypothetical protein
MEYTQQNLHMKFHLRETLSQFFLPTYGAYGHHRGVSFSFGSCSKTGHGLQTDCNREDGRINTSMFSVAEA